MFLKMPALAYYRQILYKSPFDDCTSNYTNFKVYFRSEYLLQNLILKFTTLCKLNYIYKIIRSFILSTEMQCFL